MQGGEPRVPRANGLVAHVESFPELIYREVPLANSPPKARLGPSLPPSPSPVLQFSCSANILGAYCKGWHCVRRNVKMIALSSVLKWFTILKET